MNFGSNLQKKNTRFVFVLAQSCKKPCIFQFWLKTEKTLVFFEFWLKATKNTRNFEFWLKTAKRRSQTQDASAAPPRTQEAERKQKKGAPTPGECRETDEN